MSQSQNFENHAKLVPAFHFFVLPVFAFNLVWSIFRCVRSFSAESALAAVLALAFLVGAVSLRIMVLSVQDRVIRLEMRLRMQQVFPPELRGRIPEFTVSQLVALRFASDAELPGLARRVLDEKMMDRKSIKKLIQKWEPDYLRA